MIKLPSIYRDRAVYSETRLGELKNRISTIPGISDSTNLAVTTESCGRFVCNI
jgi:hypothetical protein